MEVSKNNNSPEIRQGTLCWFCKNVFDKCSWSKDREPVEGWEATERSCRDYDSYHVYSCPEFVDSRVTEKPDVFIDDSGDTKYFCKRCERQIKEYGRRHCRICDSAFLDWTDVPRPKKSKRQTATERGLAIVSHDTLWRALKQQGMSANKFCATHPEITYGTLLRMARGGVSIGMAEMICESLGIPFSELEIIKKGK